MTIDGGMSDNPRPAMYGARYTALLANRAAEPPTAAYAVAGKHCESGDVLIERVELPEPVRGDLLAVPVTGAYTLAMSSTYNAVPRPPAVLVSDGQARLISRRETRRRPARVRGLAHHARQDTRERNSPCPLRVVHVRPVSRERQVYGPCRQTRP